NVVSPYVEIDWIKSFEYKEKVDGVEQVKNISHETAIDYFRYFLLKEVPFGNDGDYNRESLMNRVNSELSNNIGNLIQRSLSMIVKNCDGVLTSFRKSKFELDEQVLKIKDDINNLAFNRALEKIIDLSNDANKYFNDSAPWKLKKEGKDEEVNEILFETAENIRIIAILLLPFIPNSATKILDLINIKIEERNFESLEKTLESGHKVNSPEIIFPNLR
ncbi:MAG: methionyl-tRNA synthetase, partial [Rickettsiales bacterium]